eukprot:SAG11_NODE_2528_length_3253_cov_13.746988_2_plen_358_part_00
MLAAEQAAFGEPFDVDDERQEPPRTRRRASLGLKWIAPSQVTPAAVSVQECVLREILSGENGSRDAHPSRMGLRCVWRSVCLQEKQGCLHARDKNNGINPVPTLQPLYARTALINPAGVNSITSVTWYGPRAAQRANLVQLNTCSVIYPSRHHTSHCSSAPTCAKKYCTRTSPWGKPRKSASYLENGLGIVVQLDKDLRHSGRGDGREVRCQNLVAERHMDADGRIQRLGSQAQTPSIARRKRKPNTNMFDWSGRAFPTSIWISGTAAKIPAFASITAALPLFSTSQSCILSRQQQQQKTEMKIQRQRQTGGGSARLLGGNSSRPADCRQSLPVGPDALAASHHRVEVVPNLDIGHM